MDKHEQDDRSSKEQTRGGRRPPKLRRPPSPHLCTIDEMLSDEFWKGEQRPSKNDLNTWCCTGQIESVYEGAERLIPLSEIEKIRTLFDESSR